MSFFWVSHFEFFFRKKKFFFCFIPMKISPNLYGRMDESKFWCFPWFPENSLLCVILCYTVYLNAPLVRSTFFIPWLIFSHISTPNSIRDLYIWNDIMGRICTKCTHLVILLLMFHSSKKGAIESLNFELIIR